MEKKFRAIGTPVCSSNVKISYRTATEQSMERSNEEAGTSATYWRQFWLIYCGFLSPFTQIPDRYLKYIITASFQVHLS
jgi:hypothetical protein